MLTSLLIEMYLHHYSEKSIICRSFPWKTNLIATADSANKRQWNA